MKDIIIIEINTSKTRIISERMKDILLDEELIWYNPISNQWEYEENISFKDWFDNEYMNIKK